MEANTRRWRVDGVCDAAFAAALSTLTFATRWPDATRSAGAGLLELAAATNPKQLTDVVWDLGVASIAGHCDLTVIASRRGDVPIARIRSGGDVVANLRWNEIDPAPLPQVACITLRNHQGKPLQALRPIDVVARAATSAPDGRTSNASIGSWFTACDIAAGRGPGRPPIEMDSWLETWTTVLTASDADVAAFAGQFADRGVWTGLWRSERLTAAVRDAALTRATLPHRVVTECAVSAASTCRTDATTRSLASLQAALTHPRADRSTIDAALRRLLEGGAGRGKVLEPLRLAASELPAPELLDVLPVWAAGACADLVFADDRAVTLAALAADIDDDTVTAAALAETVDAIHRHRV